MSSMTLLCTESFESLFFQMFSHLEKAVFHASPLQRLKQKQLKYAKRFQRKAVRIKSNLPLGPKKSPWLAQRRGVGRSAAEGAGSQLSHNMLVTPVSWRGNWLENSTCSITVVKVLRDAARVHRGKWNNASHRLMRWCKKQSCSHKPFLKIHNDNEKRLAFLDDPLVGV